MLDCGTDAPEGLAARVRFGPLRDVIKSSRMPLKTGAHSRFLKCVVVARGAGPTRFEIAPLEAASSQFSSSPQVCLYRLRCRSDRSHGGFEFIDVSGSVELNRYSPNE